MSDEVAEATSLFTKTFVHSIIKFSNLSSFWRNARLGISERFGKLFDQYLEFNQDMFGNPENVKFFTDESAREELLKLHGGMMGFTGLMTSNSTQTFSTLVDSSCIVFAHSIMDGAALNYCKIISLIDPESWTKYVSKKKVELESLSGKSYQQILREKILEYLDKLDREPLLAKTDKLFAICQPPSKYDPLKGFKFNRSRLEKIDQVRHEIVHGLGPMPLLSNVNDEITFLLYSSNYLMCLLNRRYSLKLVPELMSDAVKSLNPSLYD